MKTLEKEQLEAVLNQWNINHSYNTFRDALKEKGLIKEEFEVGKWYNFKTDTCKCLCFATEVEGRRVWFYGLDENGNWVNKDWYSADWDWSLATDKEVETALIKEAKKRGFKEGVKFEGMDSKKSRTLKNSNFNYYAVGYLSINSWKIFDKGKWATIIEEPKVESYGTPFKCLDECPKIEGYELESLRADGLVTYKPINK
jgi:hypothetical protein